MFKRLTRQRKRTMTAFFPFYGKIWKTPAFFARGDSQISFKGVIPKEDLVYQQCCLLPAPKHIKNYNFPFPGSYAVLLLYIEISWLAWANNSSVAEETDST